MATQGYKRLFVRLMADCYYDKFYYRELKSIAKFPLSFKGIDMREMDACQTDFEESEFDLVVSNAAFEHIKNVSATLREMKRVMKKNALMHVEIHLFPSLTGGHNVPWSDPDGRKVILGKVPPWDHLRNQQYPIDSSLNRLREKDYYRFFSRKFEILEWATEYTEPDHFLTPDLRSELSEYSTNELLKRSIVVVLRNGL